MDYSEILREEDLRLADRQVSADIKGFRKGEEAGKGKAPRQGSKGPGKGKGAAKGKEKGKGKGQEATPDNVPWRRPRGAESGEEPSYHPLRPASALATPASRISLPPPPPPPPLRVADATVGRPDRSRSGTASWEEYRSEPGRSERAAGSRAFAIADLPTASP